jgi:hypothetical protein
MNSDSTDCLAGFFYDCSVKKAMEIMEYVVWVGAGFVPTFLALELSTKAGKLRAASKKLGGILKKPRLEAEVAI